MSAAGEREPRIRLRLQVRGLVQGVGFRPFVQRLAARHALSGHVRNETAGVVIEVEGAPEPAARFQEELRLHAPPLAVVAEVRAEPLPARGDRDFRILPSVRADGAVPALIPPDVATCDACAAEMADPTDRRFAYPFLNCTDCGPRFTLVSGVPYDRAATSMRSFPMCPACQAEYDDPASRRYHAQPNACPACGPRAWLVEPGNEAPGGPRGAATDWSRDGEAVRAAALRLARGEIGGIKGIGGFHLACDASDAAAVRRLRDRKGRPEKPLAIMARDLETVRRIARLFGPEEELLTGWRRPIVLLERREDAAPFLAPEVCGGSRQVGVMLPYSPLHHLLLAHGRPILVMTSGNRSDEPIARGNEEALERLAGVADFLLLHDREILEVADDSVARVARGRPVLLRRSRGWVPQPVLLPRAGPSVLAFGADLKGTCCVTRDALAFPSQFLGDLAHPEAALLLERGVEHLLSLLGVRPERIAHDAHPDYVSTRAAERAARRLGVPALAVQHHHAHALAVLAENGWERPAIAICLDGAGYGPDGTIWGGEVLRVDGARFTRTARLLPLAMPGGDRAATEPWRMAISALVAAAGPDLPRAWRSLPPFTAAPPDRVEAALQLACRPGAAPLTSSAGRLFDAAASLLGLRQRMSYEGQAAAELEDEAAGAEWEQAGPDGSAAGSAEGAAGHADRPAEPADRSAGHAERPAEPADGAPGPADRGAGPADQAAGPRAGSPPAAYPLPWLDPREEGSPGTLDVRPLVRALAEDQLRGRPAAESAFAFHAALARGLAEAARRARDACGLETAVLSGGVMQNRLLVELLAPQLEMDGFRVLLPAQVSPNDEGVALGQVWAALLL